MPSLDGLCAGYSLSVREAVCFSVRADTASPHLRGEGGRTSHPDNDKGWSWQEPGEALGPRASVRRLEQGSSSEETGTMLGQQPAQTPVTWAEFDLQGRGDLGTSGSHGCPELQAIGSPPPPLMSL